MMETLLKNNYAIIASYTGAKHLMYDYYMSKRVSAKEFVVREHCPFILSKKPIFWGIQSFVYDCRSQLSFLFDNEYEVEVSTPRTLLNIGFSFQFEIVSRVWYNGISKTK